MVYENLEYYQWLEYQFNRINYMKFSYPALLMAFNRADLTIENIENLLNNGVEELYLHIDGPRNKDDLLEQTKILSFLEENKISSRVQLLIKVQQNNLGCDPGGIAAMTWFFENVDEGIIIEDDIFPNSSFFQFMNKAIPHYKNNRKVFCISGFIPWKIKGTRRNTYLSQHHNTWGWACYKDRWIEFLSFLEINNNNLIDQKIMSNGTFTEAEFIFWKKNILNVQNYDRLMQRFLWYRNDIYVVRTTVNFVKNRGFGPRAVHSKSSDNWFGKIPVYQSSNYKFCSINMFELGRSWFYDRMSKKSLNDYSINSIYSLFKQLIRFKFFINANKL